MRCEPVEFEERQKLYKRLRSEDRAFSWKSVIRGRLKETAIVTSRRKREARDSRDLFSAWEKEVKEQRSAGLEETLKAVEQLLLAALAIWLPALIMDMHLHLSRELASFASAVTPIRWLYALCVGISGLRHLFIGARLVRGTRRSPEQVQAKREEFARAYQLLLDKAREPLAFPEPVSYELRGSLGPDGSVIADVIRHAPVPQTVQVLTSSNVVARVVLGADEGSVELADRFELVRGELKALAAERMHTYEWARAEYETQYEARQDDRLKREVQQSELDDRRTMNAGVVAALNSSAAAA